jgi:Stress responsive A/B Barrel Domain
MISHIVLFKPDPTLRQAEKLAIVEHLQTAIARCPTVRRCRVGRRVVHGLPGYEQLMAEDYQFSLILDFDDVEGLKGYLQNPAHAGIGGLFTTAASASLAYDYEVVELEDARGLL